MSGVTQQPDNVHSIARGLGDNLHFVQSARTGGVIVGCYRIPGIFIYYMYRTKTAGAIRQPRQIKTEITVCTLVAAVACVGDWLLQARFSN